MKYLIVKCDELMDGFECDANRTPICLTDDYSNYGRGYEVYKIKKDNTFELIKDYDDCLESGIAVVHYSIDEDYDEPIIIEKIPNKGRKDIRIFTELFHKYNFSEDFKIARLEFQNCGSYGEELKNRWWVITEYFDDVYGGGY